MEKIKEIAEENNLIVIEDACRAHAVEYRGKRVQIIETACYSFYPGKNLGAFGDAGMVVTNNEGIAKKIGMLRDHGGRKNQKYEHSVIGYNVRINTMHAVIRGVKLNHLGKWTEQRKKNAQIYNKLLNGIVETPMETPNYKHVYHLYVIHTKNREDYIGLLKTKEIFTGIHYPVPSHLQPSLKFLGYKEEDFSIVEQYAKKILLLPTCPELNDDKIKFVVDTIKEKFN